MAYPLGSTPYSFPVRVVNVGNRILKITSFNFHSNYFMLNNGTRNHPNFPIRIVRHPRPLRATNTVFRWNGIGGAVYIPSFPQLDRQTTSYPHAF